MLHIEMSPLSENETSNNKRPVKSENCLFSFNDSKEVKFEVGGRVHKISIDEVIPVVSRTTPSNDNSSHCYEERGAFNKLPQPCFIPTKNYKILNSVTFPSDYIVFPEKSLNVARGEIKYEMDEEDSAWLEIVNNDRTINNLQKISDDKFEIMMDCLEKMSCMKKIYGRKIYNDDICCVCIREDKSEDNLMLLCSFCEIKVHQECYGVPFLHTDSWVCRRCLLSPSKPVRCDFCPYRGGAFKQTTRGTWAHIVCVLYLPEVVFQNDMFLEPVHYLSSAMTARFKLRCYLCGRKGAGACVQCNSHRCVRSFHATCGQQAGLHMSTDVDFDESGLQYTKGSALCGFHTAKADLPGRKLIPIPPVSSVPFIPPDRIKEVAEHLKVSDRDQFIERLVVYWNLKRRLRNGVPLLPHF